MAHFEDHTLITENIKYQFSITKNFIIPAKVTNGQSVARKKRKNKCIWHLKKYFKRFYHKLDPKRYTYLECSVHCIGGDIVISEF